ncbi:MAG: hypothetical protein JWM98_2780, partial [Thermoleophilia bacterium]|nr:hypothetical protein [Thermoleophilia bacterium]
MEPTPTSAQDSAARRLALVLGAGGDGLRCVRFDAPWGRGGTTVLNQLVEAARRPLVNVPPDLRADATGDGAVSPETWIEGVLARTDSPVVVVDPVGDLEFTRAGAVADLVRRATDRDASVSVVLVDDGRPLTPMVGRALDLVEGAIAEHAPALLAALDASSDADVARVVRDAWPAAHDALVAAAVDAAGGAPGIALRFVEQELGRTPIATDGREGFAGWMDRLEPPAALLAAVLARVPGAVPTWACARLEDVGEAAVDALAATLMANERDGWIELEPGARRHATDAVPVTLARAGVRELA